ncbi:MAG: phosphatidylglycerophosphatase A [Lentisphaeria bacterium]
MKRPIAIDNTAQIFTSPQMFLAFGFGSGLSPIVPGTVGTLASVPLYWLLVHLPFWGYPWLGYFLVVLAAAIIGVYLCDYTSKKLKVHDHSGIVWDEFVGFWITMFMVPFSWQWVLLGFVLFRFFDMLKPWPISWLDKKVHGGFGIMIDDVLAGIAAWCCLQGVMLFLK